MEATLAGIGSVYFYAEDEIESVILSGDESESSSAISEDTHENNEENGGDSQDEDDEDKDEDDKDNEEYYRFVTSVMLNDSDQSGGDDGEDDEDYLPESEPQKKEIDFEDDDDGYYRVTRKEVMELVNAGVRELAKLPTPRESPSQIPMASRAHLPPHHAPFTLLTSSSSSSSTPQLLPPPPSLPHPLLFHATSQPQDQSPKPTVNGAEGHKKNRLLTALIQKMFAGTGDEDLVVDDMPMNNIRKLVARQMTMSTQLILQMLLMSDNSSEVDQQLTSSLLELSNLKDAGVRKTALLKEQLESIKLYSSSMTAAPLVYMRQLSDSDDEDGEPAERSHLPIEESSRPNILTRRRTLAMESSLTLFNVKALSNVSDLLQTVDAARKERNLRLPPDTLLAALEGGEGGTQRTLLASHENRKALFPVLRDLLETTIAPKFCERVWSCLLPSESYPLGEDFARTVDPTSLFQRSIFTPAEDDLLLRGMIMTTNESSSSTTSAAEGTDWEEVHRRFLPSKDKRLLQFRQIQLISSEENSKFQRYRELEMENKIHNSSRRWTREEEVSLLKGFQIFGNKWHMVKLYFLPYKSRNEIRLRWVYLLKLWEKADLSLKAAVKSDGTLHKSTRTFLRSIQLPSAPSASHSSSLAQPHLLQQPLPPPPHSSSGSGSSIPSLLGRSSVMQAAVHHPLPPPPLVHYPSVPPFSSQPLLPTAAGTGAAHVGSPFSLSSFPLQPQSQLPTSLPSHLTAAAPITFSTPQRQLPPQRLPPPQLEEEAVDEGVLPDSDSDEEEQGPVVVTVAVRTEREAGEGRKRRAEADDVEAQSAKRVATEAGSSHGSLSSTSRGSVSGSAERGEGHRQGDGSSQSLFASVMSQVSTGSAPVNSSR